MGSVFLSALLFGLVHPGSKLILGQNLDLLSFCTLYVGFRLLMQLPMLLAAKDSLAKSPRQWLLLALIGTVGAALQMTEFSGIADGLPVPLVSFLVYSHPLWSSVFNVFINGERPGYFGIFQTALGLAGVVLIAGLQSWEFHSKMSALVAPLSAGVLIALWVSLSSRARKAGLPTLAISFYYDFFALLALISLQFHQGPSSFHVMGAWLQSPSHFALIFVYSSFMGVLPNLLFYHGSRLASARAAGLTLLAEPVVSTLVSSWLWNEPLHLLFYAGALCVLGAAVPHDAWTQGSVAFHRVFLPIILKREFKNRSRN